MKQAKCIKLNKILRPRPGLLLIRQTRFETDQKLFTVLIFW